VAHLAIEAAQEAEQRADDEDSVSSVQEREPGYYLIAKGRPAFEQAIVFD